MLRSLLNQRLGRYLIKALLGRGGMAAVYRATDTILQRDIALKILYPQYSDDASLIERFKREAVTAASLEHPNIVPVYDVGEHDGMAFIAMKLLNGRSLQERLQEVGTLSLEELLTVVTAVAAALDYAHARGVIHRDIKPANIFLSQESEGSRPLLTDFGIAKQLDTPGLTTTGALIGTPDYMAPEQIAGRPVDARTDGYALGMLAFRCLTGRRAFEGSTQDVLLGHLYGQAPLLSTLNPALPPGLDTVLAKALATNPNERFPSAGAFVTAVRQVAQAPTSPRAVSTASQRAAATIHGAITTPGSLTTTATPPSVTPPPLVTVAPNPPPVVALPPARRTAPRSNATPWLLAVALALVSGGLAVALAFTVGRQAFGGNASVPPSLSPTPTSPASATVAPATSTLNPAPVALTTTEPSATSAPAKASTTPRPTKVPSATALPTATPEPASPTATPTATPEPASPTVPPTTLPTVTPEPASPTATPEPASPTVPPTATLVAGCPDDLLSGGFGQVYADQVTVRAGLGCPLERERVGPGAQQFFAHGMLFWWSDRNNDGYRDHIFVFLGLERGGYEMFSPVAVAALGPEPTPAPDPEVPRRGFGRIYFARSDISAALGAWISPEIELKSDTSAGVIQRFARGLMLWTPIAEPGGHKTIYVVYNDRSTFERYDDPFAS